MITISNYVVNPTLPLALIYSSPNNDLLSIKSSGAYRYGFNGKEKVDEVSGSGNHNTALFWEYDTRLGRRWNVDPKPDAWESPYVGFANNPIYFSDPSGLDPDKPISNPQNGDKHGNMTYDGELKAWVLPEVTVTDHKPPSFSSKLFNSLSDFLSRFIPNTNVYGMKRDGSGGSATHLSSYNPKAFWNFSFDLNEEREVIGIFPIAYFKEYGSQYSTDNNQRRNTENEQALVEGHDFEFGENDKTTLTKSNTATIISQGKKISDEIQGMISGELLFKSPGSLRNGVIFIEKENGILHVYSYDSKRKYKWTVVLSAPLDKFPNKYKSLIK